MERTTSREMIEMFKPLKYLKDGIRIAKELHRAKDAGLDAESAITYSMIRAGFDGMGAEQGKAIAEIAKELHKNSPIIMPVYRGCVVIPRQSYTGTLELILYHDPEWLGRDLNADTLPEFRNDLAIHGQRSGQDYYLNEIQLHSETWSRYKVFDDAMWDAAKELHKKGQWTREPRSDIGLCLGDFDTNEIKKLALVLLHKQYCIETLSFNKSNDDGHDHEFMEKSENYSMCWLCGETQDEMLQER